jgi:hypothetical protein
MDTVQEHLTHELAQIIYSFCEASRLRNYAQAQTAVDRGQAIFFGLCVASSAKMWFEAKLVLFERRFTKSPTILLFYSLCEVSSV